MSIGTSVLVKQELSDMVRMSRPRLFDCVGVLIHPLLSKPGLGLMPIESKIILNLGYCLELGFLRRKQTV